MKRVIKYIEIILVMAMALSVLLFAIACNDENPSVSTVNSEQSVPTTDSETSAPTTDSETSAPTTDSSEPSVNTVKLTFVCDGVVIPSITEEAGREITLPKDPQKTGFIFRGWYETSDFSGEKVELPSIMPETDKTYYAKFLLARRISYNYNLEGVNHTGNIAYEIVGSGESVTIKNGDDFGADGYLFMGWSIAKDGLVYPTGAKNDGQYNAGDEFMLDEDLTLYAQWAKEYDAGNGEKVYLYSPLIGKGQGASLYVNSLGEKKFGFASVDENGYIKMEFYYGENIKEGRLYEDGTFLFKDGLNGNYLRYDYVTQTNGSNILALDGYGSATYSSVVGSQTRVDMFGSYTFNSQYGDYEFTVINQQTGEETDEVFFFTLAESTVGEFTGSFIVQGGESGQYMLYQNGELYYDRLDLNGYGIAKRYTYNAETDSFVKVYEGTYQGTDDYTDFLGEWKMVENGEIVRFILNVISDPSGDISVFIQFDAEKEGELTGDNGDTLYIDGYGNARYTQGSATYEGVCAFKNTLITFIPYIESEEGMQAGGKMYFDVDWQQKMFTINNTGFITDGGVLVAYEGDASVIVIPDGVTAVANDVFKGKNVVSVTIPASVESIGSRAFENQYTLTKATFLSKTPIAMDWAKETCPFRWPSNSFIIVVPEESLEAYKTAWTDCPYTIKGSVEVTILPEFEIDNGVLVRYNKPNNAPENYEVTIPDNVLAIDKFVFRGFTFITGVNLNNVTSVGEGAFSYCENLQTVTALKVEEIGIGAFEYCVSLGKTDGKIEFPAITHIGANAFQGCEKLKLVKLGENLASIDEKAFSECHIYEDEAPLMIELSGKTPPKMGEKVFIGNISVRIKVADINVALACFKEPTFNAYSRHLYIESGSEKGVYIDGADTIELDGRAIFMKETTAVYAINGSTITFYQYDAETATYASFTGTYEEGKIAIELGGVLRNFVKVGETITYTSQDGLYTLVCRPSDIDPENYAETNYEGFATVTFNGTQTQMKIVGFTLKKIINFLDADSKRYDFTITILSGNVFSYEKQTAESYVKNITASDGSVLNLHYLGNSIYVFGRLNIDVGGGTLLPEWSDYGVLATFTSVNECTFTRMYKNTTYRITVTFSDDRTTFTYTYEIV